MIIGYAYVVGDILHVGHLTYLCNCKALCDRLVVGVLTDEAVMEKKPPPTVPFCDRFRLVAALSCVDAVVAQATYSPLTNVLEIGSDILFESTDHEVRTYPEFGGRILVMPYYPGVSSSEIKHKIQEED